MGDNKQSREVDIGTKVTGNTIVQGDYDMSVEGMFEKDTTGTQFVGNVEIQGSANTSTRGVSGGSTIGTDVNGDLVVRGSLRSSVNMTTSPQVERALEALPPQNRSGEATSSFSGYEDFR